MVPVSARTYTGVKSIMSDASSSCQASVVCENVILINQPHLKQHTRNLNFRYFVRTLSGSGRRDRDKLHLTTSPFITLRAAASHGIMLLTCPDTGDRQVLLGESIGIGLAIGLVCGVIFVSIFFIVYRSSYIQNLAAMKKDTKFTGCKNRKAVTSHTSSEPQEAQPYQTRTEIIDDKKRQHENIAVRYKNQQQEEEINVSETDYQNTDHYPHGYDNNYDQPTYENVADMSNYEYEYDYIAPSTVQRWYDEAQSSEGYVHMQSPRQT